MTQLDDPFDPSTTDPKKGFGGDSVAPGDYVGAIVNADLKDTSSGKGTGISLEIQILEGDSQGRKVFHWINYTNENKQAQDIGKAELSQLCQAIGQTEKLTDTAMLHGAPFMFRLVNQTDRHDPEKTRSKITGFQSLVDYRAEQATRGNTTAGLRGTNSGVVTESKPIKNAAPTGGQGTPWS